MQKINVIEYLPKIMTELEKGVLVNTKNGDKLNTMTIAWGQIGIEWNKFVFTTYIRHTRFTHEQIEATNEFTVSIPLERTPAIAKAMDGVGGMRLGMLLGDLDNGYVSVGNGVSLIHEIKSVKEVVEELMLDYK